MRILGETLSDADREMLPLLTDFAEEFLQAGGSVTLADLSQLSRVEITALAAAGRQRESERLQRLATALSGPLGLAEATDDDATYNTMLCHMALASMR